MRRTSVGVIALLSLGATLLTACGGDDSSQSSTPDEVTFLVNGPMTGSSAEIGTDMCNGAKLAAEKINGDGGVSTGPLKGTTVNIQCADNPDFSTEAAATIAARYLDDERIWVSMGYASSAEALAAAKVVQRAGLAVIGSAVGASFLTEDSDNVVAIFPDSQGIGYSMVDFCRAYYGGSSIGQVLANYSFFDSYLDGEAAALESEGMELVLDERYDPGAVADFSPFLAKLKRANPDCVFPGDYHPVGQNLLKGARAIGMDQPFIDFIANGPSQTAVDAGGKELIGFVFGEFLPADRTGELAAVTEEWETRHKKPLSYYPAYAYDSVLATVAAMEAGADSREAILEHISKIDVPGLVGQLKFTEDLRIEARPFLMLEQTGPTLADLETVAEYTLNPDGTADSVGVADCSARSTCQTAR